VRGVKIDRLNVQSVSMKKTVALLTLIFAVKVVFGQLRYPYQVNYIPITTEQQEAKMAFMDLIPSAPNGKTIVLLHGKNFNGFYWKDVMTVLANRGYRVIVPDQIGWGFSDKPNIHYSFHILAANTKKIARLAWRPKNSPDRAFYGWYARYQIRIDVSSGN